MRSCYQHTLFWRCTRVNSPDESVLGAARFRPKSLTFQTTAGDADCKGHPRQPLAMKKKRKILLVSIPECVVTEQNRIVLPGKGEQG